ncbi:hypothetical protein F4678DRAFT_417253 [Xylaria arbuscula]|nr:hypothetical protein F4678DRAFT_417253 [Xylaria arbuscula]
MIPYKIVQQENLQLNFGVLVDEDGYGCRIPPFLARGFYSGGSGGNGNSSTKQQRNKKGTSEEKGNGKGTRKGKEREEEKESEEGKEKEGSCHEHDALEWATCARIEKMAMSEDVRQVVLEGLAWMGKLTERCF